MDHLPIYFMKVVFRYGRVEPLRHALIRGSPARNEEITQQIGGRNRPDYSCVTNDVIMEWRVSFRDHRLIYGEFFGSPFIHEGAKRLPGISIH
jgi:hypothetical protein